MPTSVYNKTETDDLLALKVDKVTGKQLSTEDFTTDEKTKLAGIEAGAEVNVNADWNATSGDSQILNKPSIPSKTSDLTNDSGFITASAVASGYVAKDGSKVLSDNNYDSASKTKLDNLVNITAIGDNLTLTNGTLSAPASGADTNLSNITAAGKTTAANWMMPDIENGISKTTNTLYQAESNGWIYGKSSSGASITLVVYSDAGTTAAYYYYCPPPPVGYFPAGIIPVPKNRYYKIISGGEAKFIPCIGG